MILKIYSVYDAAVKQFHQPFYARTDQEAERMIISVLQDENSMLSQHPADYSVHVLGYIDTETGLIDSHDPITLMTSVRLIDHARDFKLSSQLDQIPMNIPQTSGKDDANNQENQS